MGKRESVTEKQKYFYLRFRHGRKRQWLSSSLFYYSLQAGRMKKKDRIVRARIEKVTEEQKFFCLFSSCFKPAVILPEVMMFLLVHAAEIKTLPIQRSYGWTDFEEKVILFSSEQHFGWIAHVKQRFKTMGEFRFVEFLNPNLFYTNKKIRWKRFQLWIWKGWNPSWSQFM